MTSLYHVTKHYFRLPDEIIMKLPYALFAIYVFFFANEIIVELKDLNNSSGVMYMRKPATIYNRSIVKTITEFSVIACTLSCRVSTHCDQSAIRKGDSKRECLHLNKNEKPNGSGVKVEVELLKDISPGNMCIL